MVSADLYLEKIDFRRYLNQAVCEDCGFPSCEAFISAIKAGTKKPHDCSFISRNQAYALEAINTIKELWPQVPLLMHPRPGFTGLIELNSPDSDSPVLVSGNNEYTEQVIMTVLGTTVCPFFVLFVNTDGNTVDMAMIYQTLTAEKIHKEIKETGLEKKAQRPGTPDPRTRCLFKKWNRGIDRMERQGWAGMCRRVAALPFGNMGPARYYLT